MAHLEEGDGNAATNGIDVQDQAQDSCDTETFLALHSDRLCLGAREGFSELTDDIFDALFDVETEVPTSMPVGKDDALELATSAVKEENIDASDNKEELQPLDKPAALVVRFARSAEELSKEPKLLV